MEPWVGTGEARQKGTASLGKAPGTIDKSLDWLCPKLVIVKHLGLRSLLPS